MGAFFGKIGSWIAVNKIKALIIGLVAAIAIGGTTTGIILAAGGSDDNGSDGRQVPVYQGMSITSVQKSATLPSYNTDGKNGVDYDKDNGNHNGHFKGDHTGKDEAIDEENPYPENAENETLEEEAKSSLNVIGSAEDIYYATPNEDIYINIHISNPDSFEIMSFTLNGKKYSSYMFEEGSDMETIILKYNVGDASGIVEYTIDAIKYVDGTEIKDVIIDGNKTVMAGIKTENQISANVSAVDIGTNSLSFNVYVKDNDKLVEFSGGALKAVIYDGFAILAQKDLAVGDNAISFEGLKTNTLYQYAIVGYYDDLSGDGFKMNVLYKDAFYTYSVVLFDNIVIGQEGLTFSYLWHEDHIGKTISALKLYCGTALVQAPAAGSTEITGLLSGVTYKLVAEYKNGENTESIYLEFTTKAKAAPDFSITNTGKTHTSLGFSVNVTDTDSVGAITKVELIHGTESVALGNTATHTISDLLSNNDYTLKVTYTYDLNDGVGSRTIVRELTAKTDAKAAPEIAVNAPTKTQTSVGFTITKTDTDNVGAITKIELYKGNELVKAADNISVREFTGLLSNNAYTVKVTYVYDLNDGEGAHTVTKELAITTDAKAVPEIAVNAPTKTQTSVGFAITETDTDNVGAITKIELYKGNELVKAADNINAREFTGLLSNNAYTVKVTYVYDLNDGEGAHTVTKELAITTDAKAAPTFTVNNESITTNAITAEYDISDVDSILSHYKVELYNGEALVSENTEKKINFTALSYYTNYTVKFTYKYDLNDGNGEQISVYDYDFKTLPYIDVTECSIENTSAVSEGETIFMSVKLDNPLGMTIESVVINGETYSVTTSSTAKKIFVEIVYNGQFAGGDTYLKIDRVNAKLDGGNYIANPESELSDNVFINGKLDVVKIELVNKDFEVFDWAFPSDAVYVLITLNNPTGYTVDSIVQAGTDVGLYYGNSNVTSLTKLDNNRLYYPVNLSNGWNYRSLSSLSYRNEYIEKTITYSNMHTNYAYRVASDEIKYISTPADLLNMDDRYYYELKNDIDLAGLHWQGNVFYGVLDGKGYSIKNMSFVGTIKNTNAYLGLFSQGSGVIQNVNIVEATIIAEITSDDGNGYVACCGGLIGYTNGQLNIHGCTVDEDTVINVKNNVGSAYAGGLVGYVYDSTSITNCSNSGNVSLSATGSHAFAGGLVGDAGSSTLTNCTNSGNVNASATGSHAFAGGLVGDASSSTLTNCTNSGNVSADTAGDYAYAYAGGLVGYVESSSTLTITNCTNSGNVSASATGYSSYAGGLVGDASSSTLTNCTNSGNVSANSTDSPAFAGGLVGSAGSSTLTNCTNSGSVSASAAGHYSYAGGLVGNVYYDSTLTITNCSNSGSVSADATDSSAYAGGLVGYVYLGSTLTITNCTHSGNVSASATGYRAYTGGLVGDVSSSSTLTITNSYSLVSGNRYNGESCTLEQLNSKEFYTDVLGWSEDDWDFSELDVENGKCPIPKMN